MSAHAIHRMHDHSLATYREEETKLSARATAVLEWVGRFGVATDRQVMQGMGFTDMNSVRPRITELLERGKLTQVGEVRCPITGKTVRKVGIPRGQRSLFS
jgi:hypothetical protein